MLCYNNVLSMLKNIEEIKKYLQTLYCINCMLNVRARTRWGIKKFILRYIIKIIDKYTC